MALADLVREVGAKPIIAESSVIGNRSMDAIRKAGCDTLS
jgi:hypothetical protein